MTSDVQRKHSKKRQAILEALCSTKEHPTAEMLYQALKPSYPELSLGTVYRNLSVLAEEGLVVSVGRVDGQERYDGTTSAHAHFICRQCRSVIDIPLPGEVEEMYQDLDEKMGLLADGCSLSVSGVCTSCRRRKAV